MWKNRSRRRSSQAVATPGSGGPTPERRSISRELEVLRPEPAAGPRIFWQLTQPSGAEHGLRVTRDHVAMSLAAGHWKPNCPSQLSESATNGKQARLRQSKFHDLALIAINYIAEDDPAECVSLMRVCFKEIKALLGDRDPFLQPDLLDILVQLHRRGLYEICDKFVGFLKDMSAIVLGPTHAISLLWEALHSVEQSEARLHLAREAFDVLVHSFEEQLGREHASTIILYSHRSLFKDATTGPADAETEDWARRDLQRLEAVDPTDRRCLLLRFCIARDLDYHGKSFEAGQVVRDAIRGLVPGQAIRPNQLTALSPSLLPISSSLNTQAPAKYFRDAFMVAGQCCPVDGFTGFGQTELEIFRSSLCTAR